MNTSEIDSLKQQVEQLGQFDLPAMLGESFPDQEVSQLTIGRFSAIEIISYTERLVESFESHLDQDSSRFWNREYFWGTETMNAPRVGVSFEKPRKLEINQVMAELIDSSNSRNWDQFAISLESAIGFLLTVSGWLPPSTKKPKRTSNKFSHLIDDLNLRREQFVALFKEIQGIKKTYSENEANRQHDLESVATELESAKNTVKEISSLLQNASDSNGQITSLLGTQRENLATANTELTNIATQRGEIATAIEELTKKLQEAEKRLSHMQEKESWVNELAGTAAAGALGHKFESRRSQLGTASSWWLGGTVASIILAAAWLGGSHKYFVIDKGDVWQTLAVNFGLLLPAIFIVGFFAKQFSKIRQFEEEYAFRSAVAMTLGAFADRLKSSEHDTGSQEYNKLILQTVERLYKLPVLLAEKTPSPGLLGRASPTDALKAATELVKQVKSPLSE
jgi:DNA repair exonuclease SbcCD ATPase subunit